MTSPRKQPSQADRIAKLESRLRKLETRRNIVPNSSLNSPVLPFAANNNAGAFALSTTVITTPCSILIPVPAGYSSALVLAISDFTFGAPVSPSGAVYYGSCRTAIQGDYSPFGQQTRLLAGDQQFVSNSFAKVVTGLTDGSTINVGAQAAASGTNLPAGDGTWVNLNAFAMFIR